MFGYVASTRILMMVPTLLAISVIVFVIIQLPPGDYFTTYINELQSRGESGRPEQDRLPEGSSTVSIGRSINNISSGCRRASCSGDLGYLLRDTSLPVRDRGWRPAVLLTFVVSIATIAVHLDRRLSDRCLHRGAAVQHRRLFTLTFIGFIGFATPNFLLALVLQYRRPYLVWHFHRRS